MEVISKQTKSKSHEEFETLLSQDLGNRKFKEGGIAIGTIEEIGNKFVFIDLGLKSSGAVPIEEFKLTKELDKIKVGSKIEVLLEKIENRDGEIVISREKARKVNSWNRMQKAFENKKEVKGIILSKCKGGFIVDVDSCLCFLPGSQIDIRPLKSYDHLMNSPQTFEVCKIDKKRANNETTNFPIIAEGSKLIFLADLIITALTAKPVAQTKPKKFPKKSPESTAS